MDREKIGKILIELRGEKSQAQVAEDIGVSSSAIAMYESGERIPRDDIKLKISNYYGKPIGDIFYT